MKETDKGQRFFDFDVFICQVDVHCVLLCREQSAHEGELNKDRRAAKQAKALSDVAAYAPSAHMHRKHTHKIPQTRSDTDTRGRQQGPVSNHS